MQELKPTGENGAVSLLCILVSVLSKLVGSFGLRKKMKPACTTRLHLSGIIIQSSRRFSARVMVQLRKHPSSHFSPLPLTGDVLFVSPLPHLAAEQAEAWSASLSTICPVHCCRCVCRRSSFKDFLAPDFIAQLLSHICPLLPFIPSHILLSAIFP